jgi:hypothetical protein
LSEYNAALGINRLKNAPVRTANSSRNFGFLKSRQDVGGCGIRQLDNHAFRPGSATAGDCYSTPLDRTPQDLIQRRFAMAT